MSTTNFLKWFKQQVQNDNTNSDTLNWLVFEPKFDVISWSGYDINNYSFYTKIEDEKGTMQNSGVMVVIESIHFSSSKDKYLVMALMSYFVIEDIWVIDCTSFRVFVFKCKWVDSNSGLKNDDLCFTLVDLENVGYIEESFIMAYQAKQVFYVTDPTNKQWSVVLHGRIMHGTHENDDLILNISEIPSFTTNMSLS